MRLFAGIAIPRETCTSLTRLVEQLRPAAPSLRWSRPGNLHITTKFLGEVPEEQLDPVIAALEAVAPVGKLDIAIRGLGWFPNPHAPRVFWCGVDAPAALANLARATDAALIPLGVPREMKKYSPHLTLARVSPGTAVSALQQRVATLPGTEFGRFTATEFHLYLSELSPSGSRYTTLAGFPLEAS